MRDIIVGSTATVFAVLSAIHVYWAAGGSRWKASAIPSIAGKPAFSPSSLGTLAVAVALAVASITVAIAGGLVVSILPIGVATTVTAGLAAVLAVRAIGDFRLVGLFKTRGDGRFAQLDTTFYSPLCLALATAAGFIAWTNIAG